MKLIPDAWPVLKKALSLRFIELSALAQVLIEFVPYVSDYLPWWLPLALLALAYVGRLIKQDGGKNADQ